MQKKRQRKPKIYQIPPKAGTYGGIIPHGGFLKNLALREKSEKLDRASKSEKIKLGRQKTRQKQLELYYIFAGFNIRKDDVADYINGNVSIPPAKLSLGYKSGLHGILSEDEQLVRRNPEWQIFAQRVFGKLVDQLNNREVKYSHYKGGRTPDPNSWSSLSRQRVLLVKKILIEAHTLSAQLLFDDYMI